jgi:hypothetical protein
MTVSNIASDLARSGYLSDTRFIAFLRYLRDQCFAKPEYAMHIQ